MSAPTDIRCVQGAVRADFDVTPGAYGCGELVFHGSYDRPPERVAAPSVTPGTLVAFRSETTHEVTIVTHGVRYSIASWYR
jgi:predicted 2-oxoglutarate/Fe(II)-dependent dioxygenase YbiX